MSIIPKLPSYPLSSIQTGSYTSGGEYVIYNTGLEYVGSYFSILGRDIAYTGKFPYDPNNESTSTPKSTSNIPLKSFSSLGITDPGDPKIPAEFSPVPLLEHYQNTVMPRFFARDLIKNQYREISFDDYIKIKKKNPAWDWKNWQVKTIHQGWKLNDLFRSCYLHNKTRILYMDKGEVFPPPSTPPVTPPLLAISDIDENDPIPWPGFKEWFTDNTWVERYFFNKNSSEYLKFSGNKRDIQSATSTQAALDDPQNIYTVDDPKIPIEFKAYIPYATTGPELSIFTEFFCEVEQDVEIAPGGINLTPIKLPPNEVFKFRENDTYFRCNLSEIFLPSPKNPNAVLTNPRPELAFKHNGISYPSGQFCKTQQGQFFAGNLPPSTSKYNPAVKYPDSPRELLEVKKTLPISDATPNSQIQEAWVYLVNDLGPKKDFQTIPYLNGKLSINTKAFDGKISQPFLFAEEANAGVLKLDRRYFSEIPYNSQTSFQVRKIFYKYVTKDLKYFLKKDLSLINSFTTADQEVPTEYFYEGWIHYFDPITNEDNPYFNIPNTDPSTEFLRYAFYTPGEALPFSNANYWGIRTGVLPSTDSDIVFRLNYNISYSF
jgi:hypothetical protein